MAGDGACSGFEEEANGVQDMKRRMPGRYSCLTDRVSMFRCDSLSYVIFIHTFASKSELQLLKFSDANHSIHNSARADFLNSLKQVIDQAQATT